MNRLGLRRSGVHTEQVASLSQNLTARLERNDRSTDVPTPSHKPLHWMGVTVGDQPTIQSTMVELCSDRILTRPVCCIEAFSDNNTVVLC